MAAPAKSPALIFATVSVPFARGTPLWQKSIISNALILLCFSPLREGDTSVARCTHPSYRKGKCFSPLREGDTSVARQREQ